MKCFTFKRISSTSKMGLHTHNPFPIPVKWYDVFYIRLCKQKYKKTNWWTNGVKIEVKEKKKKWKKYL